MHGDLGRSEIRQQNCSSAAACSSYWRDVSLLQLPAAVIGTSQQLTTLSSIAPQEGVGSRDS
jgi:hypothetical protein